MIKLQPFTSKEFDLLISWISSNELLIQIAGSYFSYPLTATQLQHYLEDKHSYSFSIVDSSSNKIIGHSEIIVLENNVCKLDKILIGDKANRGKGLGQQVILKLLAFSFENLGAEQVELYVYDWNTAAIRSYERAGFVIDHNKQLQTDTGETTWIALNMAIDKEKWQHDLS